MLMTHTPHTAWASYDATWKLRDVRGRSGADLREPNGPQYEVVGGSAAAPVRRTSERNSSGSLMCPSSHLRAYTMRSPRPLMPPLRQTHTRDGAPQLPTASI